jgi:hypothetical protein
MKYMMKKSTLAENMLRYRAKNLSETAKQQIIRLAEIISEQDDAAMADDELTGGSYINIIHPDSVWGKIGVKGKESQTQPMYAFKVRTFKKQPGAAVIVLEAEHPNLLTIQLNVTPTAVQVLDVRPGANLVSMIRKGSLAKQGIEEFKLVDSTGKFMIDKFNGSWKPAIKAALEKNPGNQIKQLQATLK